MFIDNIKLSYQDFIIMFIVNIKFSLLFIKNKISYRLLSYHINK
jgi:hypothetical protein